MYVLSTSSAKNWRRKINVTIFTGSLSFVCTVSSEFAGLTTFEHWPVRTAKWMGEFDPKTASYSSINYDNIQHALNVIQAIVDRYSGHPAVLGLEPVNEPWQYTPIDALKRFYWEGYLIVKRGAPYWKYIMHDSFRFDPNIWGVSIIRQSNSMLQPIEDSPIALAVDIGLGFYGRLPGACARHSYLPSVA